MNERNMIRPLIDWTQSQITAHESWRRRCLNLIASENHSSKLVSQLQCNDFMHRYTYWLDDNPLTRYYQGCRYVREVELKAIDLAKETFQADYADIRPISGMTANLGVLLGLTRPNDLVIECGRDIGGHMTATKLTSSKIINIRVMDYPADTTRYNIDVEKAKALILNEKPRLLTLGASIFPFPHPVEEIVEAAKEAGAYVSYDASHVLGLIAGGQFQRPLDEGVDIMLGSTHKTFAGPQGGLILSRNLEAFKLIKLCPNVVDNHHSNRIPALIAALTEYQEFGKSYAIQTINNAKALGAAMSSLGFEVLFKEQGFTKSHTILVDVSRYGQGRMVAQKLEEGGIIVNGMQVPRDVVSKSPFPTGVRIGVQEMTRFGMRESEMRTIAGFFKEILIDTKDPKKVWVDVARFRSDYQDLKYCYEAN